MKKIIIIFGPLLVLGSLGVYFFGAIINGSFGNGLLSCEEALNASSLFTKETWIKVNGIELFKFMSELEDCSQNKSLDDCSSVENSYEEGMCRIMFGIKASSIEECKDDYECLKGYSASHLNNCEELINYRETAMLKNICLSSLAYENKDISECNKIDQISIIDMQTNEAAYYSRNKCLWGVSDRINDIDICEKMSESSEKDLCFFTYAIKNQDSNVCNKISVKFFSNAKDLCLGYDELSVDMKEKGIGNLLVEL